MSQETQRHRRQSFPDSPHISPLLPLECKLLSPRAWVAPVGDFPTLLSSLLPVSTEELSSVTDDAVSRIHILQWPQRPFRMALKA